MYMQIEGNKYWVVKPKPDELEAIGSIPRRKKFASRVPYWLLGVAMVVCLLVGAILIVSYGASGGPWWTAVVQLGLPLAIAISALVFIPVYDYRAPLKKLASQGRAFNLETGLGWTFVNRVLFVGDRHLDGHRQREVLQHADQELIDQFWLDELNQTLLRRYYDATYERTKDVLHAALIYQARLIIKNIEPYVQPLRAKQAAEDAEAALHEDNAAEAELTETRRFLLEEGLLPNG